MEFKARVIKTLGVERGVSKKSGKEWSKGTIVVEYGDEKYPRQAALQNFKQADEFANLPLGVEYTFYVGLDSHEFNGRYYTSVDCWKWEQSAGQPAAQPAIGTTDPYAASGLGSGAAQTTAASNDLPF